MPAIECQIKQVDPELTVAAKLPCVAGCMGCVACRAEAACACVGAGRARDVFSAGLSHEARAQAQPLFDIESISSKSGIILLDGSRLPNRPHVC